MDYNRYKEIQVSRSNEKWSSKTFIVHGKNNLDQQMIFFRDNYEKPESIICLGIRNGNEYEFFKDCKYTRPCEVYGVDININVKSVGQNCYCYDFSKLPKDWGNKFDLVYSNSIDHAYDLDETINEWHRICKKYCLITFSKQTRGGADRFSFDIDKIEKLTDKYFDILKVWEYKKYISVLFKKK